MRSTTKLRPPFRLKYPGWAWVASSHARTRLGGATVTGTAQRYSGDGVARGFGATHGVGSSDAIGLAETLSPAATTLIIKYRCNGTGGGGFGRLLQKGTTTNGEASLFIESSTGRLVWHRTNTSGTVLFSGRITDATTVDGLVHTLVLAHDGVSGTPTAFLDGAPQTYSFMSISTTNAANNTDAYRLGNRSDGIRGWDGLIESVVCLDLALPSAELRAISLDPSLVFRPAPEFSEFSSGVSGGSTNLVIQDASHAHSADALGTTTDTQLVVADSSHGHTAESPTLSMELLLAVADALHAHVADNIALDTSSAIALTIQDSTHAHAADGVALTLDVSLVVAESLHAHQADGVVLTTVFALTVADSTHGHTADNVVLFFSTFTESQLLEILAYIQENLMVPTAAEIAAAVWASASGALVKKLGTNRFVTDPATGIATLYDDDGVTPLQQWEMYEDAAGTIAYRGRGAELRIPI